MIYEAAHQIRKHCIKTVEYLSLEINWIFKTCIVMIYLSQKHKESTKKKLNAKQIIL